MRVEEVGQFPAFHALGEAGVILYLRRAEDLPSGSAVLDEGDAHAGADEVKRGSDTGRAGTDDCGIVQHQRAFSIMPTRWDLATAPVT